METISELLKKHPWAITFVILYTGLCSMGIRSQRQIDELIKKHSGERVVGIEDFGLSGLAILIFVIAFFVFSSCAIASKTGTRFYLGLLFVILVEAFAAMRFG